LNQPQQLSLFREHKVDSSWVARHLGISEPTVLRLIKKELLEGFQLVPRGSWHILYESVLKYEANIREKYGLHKANSAAQKRHQPDAQRRHK